MAGEKPAGRVVLVTQLLFSPALHFVRVYGVESVSLPTLYIWQLSIARDPEGCDII